MPTLDILLGGNAALFGVPALIGTLFFVGRFALMLFAGDGDLHQDVGLHGYRRLVAACAENPQIAPALLLIEQMPKLMAEQGKAIQNLKIDKITVWEGGRTGQAGRTGATAAFLSGLIGSLPAVHEPAHQAGIELPAVLGKVKEEAPAADTTPAKRPKG